MKLILACSLLSLSLLTGACNSSPTTQTPKEAFFRSGSTDLESQVRSLQRIQSYTQSKLGIGAYDFDFFIPEGRKLEATFRAELDGKIVPELSGTWHIRSSEGSENKPGVISIYHFDPPYSDQATQAPLWELHFQGPSGSSKSWSSQSPFRRSKQSQSGYGTSASTSNWSSLEEDKEGTAWEYHASHRADGSSGDQSYDFKYVLTIKSTKMGEGEKPGEISKEVLPTGK